MRPSFLAHITNGMLWFIASVLFFINYKQLTIESTIQILLLLSIGVVIHGILHHYEEIYYDFNPLIGHWGK